MWKNHCHQFTAIKKCIIDGLHKIYTRCGKILVIKLRLSKKCTGILDVIKSLSSINGYQKMYGILGVAKSLPTINGFANKIFFVCFHPFLLSFLMTSLLLCQDERGKALVFNFHKMYTLTDVLKSLSSNNWLCNGKNLPPSLTVVFNDVTSCLAGRTTESPGSCPWRRRLSRCWL
jgi:hypothetical protein